MDDGAAEHGCESQDIQTHCDDTTHVKSKIDLSGFCLSLKQENQFFIGQAKSGFPRCSAM